MGVLIQALCSYVTLPLYALVTQRVEYLETTPTVSNCSPDATPEELIATDATCIICREEMTAAKKLVCRHLFHVHCLRSWLERQNTCPTSRALVIPPENGMSTTASKLMVVSKWDRIYCRWCGKS